MGDNRLDRLGVNCAVYQNTPPCEKKNSPHLRQYLWETKSWIGWCKDFCQCDRKHSRTLLAAALMSSALSGHSPHELRTSGCTEGSKQGMICGSVKEIKCASEASQPEAGVNSCIREGSRTKNIEERMQIVTSRREGVVCNA
eukprot:83316-Pelagomonas_calceolata.AAC.1